MYIVKVLKRKDAASVIVAICVAMSLTQLTTIPVFRLANWLSGLGDPNFQGYYGNSANWRNDYLSPAISVVLQLVVLEILVRLFVWVHPLFVRKKK